MKILHCLSNSSTVGETNLVTFMMQIDYYIRLKLNSSMLCLKFCDKNNKMEWKDNIRCCTVWLAQHE